MSKAGVAMVASWALISALLLILALHCWPVMDGDPIGFMPPSVAYARGEGLVNVVLPGAKMFDPLGQGRLVYHGWLYELILGAIMPGTTYKALFIALAMMEALAMAACGCFLFLALDRAGLKHSYLGATLAALSMFGIATTVFGLRGRPEPFAVLLLAVAGAFFFARKARIHTITVGIVLGALAASHPAGCVMASMLYCAYLGWVSTNAEALKRLLLSFMASLATLALLLLVYPYSIVDWIQGMASHSRSALAPDLENSPFKFSYYFFFVPRASFYGVLYGVAALCLLHLGVQRRARIRSKLFFGAGLLLFLAAFAGFNLRVYARSYNMQVLAPFAFAALIAWAGASKIAAAAKWKRCAAYTVLLLACGLSATGFVHRVALFPYYLKQGQSYDEAREQLAEARRTLRGPIQIDTGLFTLTEEPEGLLFCEPTAARYLIRQQAWRGRTSPPEVAGFRLIRDGFSRELPRFLGVGLAHTSGGFNFAVYERIAPGEPQAQTPAATTASHKESP